MTPYSFTVTIADPLTITSTLPKPNSTNVPIDSLIVIVFNQAINISTLDAELIYPTGERFPCTSMFNAPSNTLTLIPSALLTYGTVYTVSVNTETVSGVAPSIPFTSAFTTVSN